MYERNDKEVREFLVHVLDKLPGVMLDLMRYHPPPQVTAHSQNDPAVADSQDETEVKEKPRSFVDILAKILNETHISS